MMTEAHNGSGTSAGTSGVVKVINGELPAFLCGTTRFATLDNHETVRLNVFKDALVVSQDAPGSAASKSDAVVLIDHRWQRFYLDDSALLRGLAEHTLLPDIVKSSAYSDASKERVIDEPILFLAGYGSREPYHWPHDALTRLLAAQKIHKDISVLIPSDNPASRFIRESLDILGIAPARIQVVHPGERIRTRELWLCENLDAYPLKQVALLSELRARMLTGVGCDPSAQIPNESGKRVYISRQGSINKRSIENHNDFAELARRYEFAEVRMEQLSLADQIRLAAKTTRLLAPHGAGLFHTLYMPGGQVVELFPVDDNGRETNARCWDHIIAAHRAENRPITWRALESSIVRKDPAPDKQDRFTIVADIARVEQLLCGIESAALHEWTRLPLG